MSFLQTSESSVIFSQPLIHLENVVKAYQTAAGDFLALKSVSTTLYRGELVGIFGKSGAGKTTLVNMITGVDHLTSGQVIVGSTSVHSLNENQRALWRGLNMGVVYQNFQLMPTLSLLDNVLLPMDLCGSFRGRASVERAKFLLEQVELQDHLYKLPSAISGGQQQRVAIARALANDPPILIADEPTGRLDSTTAEVIFDIFIRLAQQGKTILMVTHDYNFSQRVLHSVILNDGQIVQDVRGSTEHVAGHLHSPAQPSA